MRLIATMNSLGFVVDVNDKPLRIWKSLLGEKELLGHGKRKGPSKVLRALISCYLEKSRYLSKSPPRIYFINPFQKL